MAQPKVHSRTTIAEDLELHVTTTTAAGGVTIVDVRQYFPSLKRYGRGVSLPRHHVADVVAGLRAVIGTTDA